MSIKWLETARLAGQVKRTHIVPTIQTYTVAEHTYNAVLIAHELCQLTGNTNEHVIAKMLMTHDVEEVYTGDFPAYIKKHEGIAEAVAEIEFGWSQNNLPMHHAIIHSDATEQDMAIAKLADTMELVMFCIDEMNLGNRHPALIEMRDKACGYMLNKASAIKDREVNKMAMDLFQKATIATNLKEIM